MRISDWSSDVCSSDLDFVEIRKAEAKPATRVVFAPAQKNLRLQGSSEALRRTFGMRRLVAGDVVSTSGQQRVDRGRSEERRVGEEGVITFSTRRSPYHANKKEE